MYANKLWMFAWALHVHSGCEEEPVQSASPWKSAYSRLTHCAQNSCPQSLESPVFIIVLKASLDDEPVALCCMYNWSLACQQLFSEYVHVILKATNRILFKKRLSMPITPYVVVLVVTNSYVWLSLLRVCNIQRLTCVYAIMALWVNKLHSILWKHWGVSTTYCYTEHSVRLTWCKWYFFLCPQPGFVIPHLLRDLLNTLYILCLFLLLYDIAILPYNTLTMYMYFIHVHCR